LQGKALSIFLPPYLLLNHNEPALKIPFTRGAAEVYLVLYMYTYCSEKLKEILPQRRRDAEEKLFCY
jgi:hypothetical protein